jgi:hypothetical protein
MVEQNKSRKKRRLDILKGQLTVPAEFYEPLPQDERAGETRFILNI